MKDLLESNLSPRTSCRLQGLVMKVFNTTCHTRCLMLSSAAITNVVFINIVISVVQTATVLFCSVLGQEEVTSWMSAASHGNLLAVNKGPPGRDL